MKVQDLVKVRRAIISVYDKKGLGEFASSLVQLNSDIELYSSSGTSVELQKKVMKNVKEISDYTKFPEMPSGLVKTLHPKIHAGILAEPGNEEHSAYMQMHGIKQFDLIVVNLYPFSAVASDPLKTVEDARKNMDIGGVSLIEAASKNFLRIAVVTDPLDYSSLISGMKKNGGCIDLKTRVQLAKKALKYLASYLGSMSGYYEKKPDNAIQKFYGVEKHEWQERLQERLHKDS
jgi:phosphoribosylaminoimidazolecarboxamide formyltransferase/IMP cyclohydrolase